MVNDKVKKIETFAQAVQSPEYLEGCLDVLEWSLELYAEDDFEDRAKKMVENLLWARNCHLDRHEKGKRNG